MNAVIEAAGSRHRTAEGTSYDISYGPPKIAAASRSPSRPLPLSVARVPFLPLPCLLPFLPLPSSVPFPFLPLGRVGEFPSPS